MPDEFAQLVSTVRERVVGDRNITISVHCHNDLGLAVANSLAAIDAGARQVECTINGIGERAGNASLEEFVMAMHVRADQLPFETERKHARALSDQPIAFQRSLACDVQPNKAIVGRNAFAHEAGIHQHGVINNPLCYEIMTPESVGVPNNNLVLGKHSGRHALALRYEDLGYSLDASLNSTRLTDDSPPWRIARRESTIRISFRCFPRTRKFGRNSPLSTSTRARRERRVTGNLGKPLRQHLRWVLCRRNAVLSIEGFGQNNEDNHTSRRRHWSGSDREAVRVLRAVGGFMGTNSILTKS